MTSRRHSSCVQWLLVFSLIFLSAEFHMASCDNFYILTSLSNQCPDEFPFERCLTLQRFFNSFSDNQNMTLFMESGTHSLTQSTFILANRQNFTMLPAEANSNPRVTCGDGSTDNPGFILRDISHIQIRGVSFVGCTSTLGDNGNSVFINDVSFMSSVITIQAITDSVQLIHVNFTNSPARGSIETVRDSTHILIMDTIFTGGAIFEVQDAAEITIMDSTVQQVSQTLVLMHSTKVTVIRCQFIDNNVGSENIGGGLYMASINATVKDCIFSNNFANSGSAIASDSVNLTVIGTNFTSNTADNIGCIYPRSGRSRLTVINSVFTANAGNDVAGIGTFNLNTRLILNVIGSVFIENSGGAISTAEQQMITITNSSFVKNSESRRGGAVFDRATRNYTITGCLFDSNTIIAERNDEGLGGAISMIRTPLILEYSNFIGNFAAREGGAIHTTARLTMKGTNFTNNVATNRGGAVKVERLSPNTIPLTMSNCYLRDNRVQVGSGGAIHVDSDNTAIYIDNSHFAGNTAEIGTGGAIHQEGEFTNISLVDSTFDRNSALSCGVIDIDDVQHRRVEFTRSTFTSNVATGTGTSDGGGVLCVNIASISMTDCTFNNNSAQHGGVLNVDDSNVRLDRCLFIQNSANRMGGVAYTNVNPVTYSVRLSTFLSNSAGVDGGAVYLGIIRSQMTIEKSSFGSNSAQNRGGMAAINGSQLVIDNQTNIYDNTASRGPAISACTNSQIVTSSQLTLTETDSGCNFYTANINSFNISELIQEELSTTTAAPEIMTTETTNIPLYTTVEEFDPDTTDGLRPTTDDGSTHSMSSITTMSNSAYNTRTVTLTLAMCMSLIILVSV